MIGCDNYAANITPSITVIDDDSYNNNNNVQQRLNYSNESNSNGNSPTIECDYANGNVVCLSNSELNLREIPITVLRAKSRDILSKRLNAIKVILSENGVPRDWRGVLQCIGLNDVNIQSNDPMKEVLTIWCKEDRNNATIGRLQNILGNIDRWDVVDDTNEYFVEDSKIYLRSKSKLEENNSDVNHNSTNEYKGNLCDVDESSLLTLQDIILAKQGLPPQKYDAYVLFANEDINFATEIIEKMEDFGLKICVKERDLVGGTFESDAIMRMIAERCERLVVILSPAFFKSPANTFFLKFAQSVGIAEDKRKIIPCVYEQCTIPPSLSYYSTLYYNRSPRYTNFWDKLRQSIASHTEIPRIVITEMDRSPTPTLPAIDKISHLPSAPPQIQIDYCTDLQQPEIMPRKRKDKSKSPKPSTPTTPKSLKQMWTNLPKIGSQNTISTSMWTLRTTDQIGDKENGRCHSSLSLNNSISSPTPTEYKKNKWYNKPFNLNRFLSPNPVNKISAESDSSLGLDNSTKKKKWYRKRIRNRSKVREAVAET